MLVGAYFNLRFPVGNREPLRRLWYSCCYIYVVPLTIPQAFNDFSPRVLPYAASDPGIMQSHTD